MDLPWAWAAPSSALFYSAPLFLSPPAGPFVVYCQLVHPEGQAQTSPAPREACCGQASLLSGRGDAGAAVGLWGAEPVGCPLLALPTFRRELSTSARLQGSGLRRFIWQELTEGSSQPQVDTCSTSCSRNSRQRRPRWCACKCGLAQAAASGPSYSISATSLLQKQMPPWPHVNLTVG